MRATAVGIGATATAGVGLSGRSPGPAAVGSANALAPVVVAIGGAVAIDWALREFDVIGSDPPAEGLTEDALRQNAFETAKARNSTNKSTIIDNRNILDGANNIAYTDGKIAAIEKLNEEASQSEVEDAAIAAAESYFTTIEKNLLRSWNESVQELDAIRSRGEDHPDIDSVYRYSPDSGELLANQQDSTSSNYLRRFAGISPTNATLADGTEFEVFEIDGEADELYEIQTSVLSASDSYEGIQVVGPDEEVQLHTDPREWNAVYEDLTGRIGTVTDGLSLWVNEVYGEVQSGEIEISDLLTPREQASMLSDDEEYPQAVADLIALNIPVDPDREATITLQDRDITLSGLMAPTSPPADGFVVGQTYDPPAESWDLYFTYDPSKGSGGWTDFETEISEGTLVFTSEPYEASLYRVPTNAGTVEVTTSDFTESDSGGTWTADVSDQLERVEEEWTDFETGIDGGTVTFTALPDEPAEFDITATDGDSETVTGSDFTDEGDGTFTVETGLGISEVDSVTARIERWSVPEGESVSVSSEDGSTGYETVQIKEPFTLEELADSEGNTYGEAEFSQTEPQTDENYITQEEWDDLESKNQELIDKYEEATQTDDGAGGGGGGFLSGSDQNWGLIAAGAGAVALGWGYITGDDR